MAQSEDANESRKIFDNYLYGLIKSSNLLFDDVAKKFKINDLDDTQKAGIVRVTVYFVIYLAYKSILQVHKGSAERITNMAFSYLNLIHLNIQEKRLAEGKQREDTSAYRQEEYNELRQQLDKCEAIFPPFETKNDDEWVKLYLASAVGWYSYYIAGTCGIKGDNFLRWAKDEKNILGSFWVLVGMIAEAIEKSSMDLLVALDECKKR